MISCIVIRLLIDFISKKDKKILRQTIRVLSGFLGNGIPLVMKSINTYDGYSEKMQETFAFQEPEVLLTMMWGSSEEYENSIEKPYISKDVQYILQALSEIKPDSLSEATKNFEKSAKLEAHSSLYESSEIALLRKEANSILLKNNGKVPTESNPEDFSKYQLIMQKINKKEEENPTIFSDIDEIYKSILKEK